MEKVEVEVSGTLKHEYTNPISIEIARGQRGSYGWTIKVAGTDLETICDQLQATDNRLKQDFPQPEGG